MAGFVILVWGNLIYNQVLDSSWLSLPLAYRNYPSKSHQLSPRPSSQRDSVDEVTGMKR